MTDLYTAASAQQEMLFGLGNRTNLVTRVAVWFDEAQVWLAKSELELPRLETVVTLNTVVNQPEYSLLAAPWSNPNDIIGLRLLKNVSTTQNLRLYRFDFDEYRSLSSQAKGPPNQWARKGTTLALDPIPDAIYPIQVDYRRRPLPGVMEVDSEYQTVLIGVGIYLGFVRMQQVGKAREVFSTLPQWVQIRLQEPLSQDQWEMLWDEPQMAPSRGGPFD